MHKETSTSKLLNSSLISTSNIGSTNGYGILDSEYEELTVLIKKSERGFGFELRNGILIVNVFPSKLLIFFRNKKQLNILSNIIF